MHWWGRSPALASEPGRIFTNQFMQGSPQSWVTALEAIAGLLVEGIFITLLTQRFFNR